jgi:hypothetical protein
LKVKIDLAKASCLKDSTDLVSGVDSNGEKPAANSKMQKSIARFILQKSHQKIADKASEEENVRKQ